jgi:signal transduction histidine kinase/ActR/RegA family two-component response regulator
MSHAAPHEERVLLLAPTLKDGAMTRTIFLEIGVTCVPCLTVDALCEEISIGAGAVVLTEHAVGLYEIGRFADCLQNQPPWSDLPVVVLAAGGANSALGRRAMETFGNVTVLERPVQMATLASVVRTLIRSRQRQYQIREHLRERESLLASERSARSEAERVSRVKDEFLATLSHELRTPLNAILGWSHILTRRIPEKRSEQDLRTGLETIERNARAQTQIIEDLLDMSRIINGKVHLEMERLDLVPIMKAALQTASPAAEAKEIALRSRLNANAGEISGDANRLQQVFWNLLSNATKFTPRGGRIDVVLEPEDNAVRIDFIDSGEGIPAEVIAHVFDRFRQADSSTTRRHGGLGLGLAIAKQLVELHGGTIGVRSAGLGLGSTFTVTLPATPAQEASHPLKQTRSEPAEQRAEAKESAPVSLDGVTVLVVDDEPDARSLVKRLLEDSNATVFTACSAKEALQLVEEKRPQVLVSDIGMPIEDGYLLIQKIRTLEKRNGCFTPALALTAYARGEDRDHAIRHGFQGHIRKPVQPGELLTSVAILAKRRHTSTLIGASDSA